MKKEEYIKTQDELLKLAHGVKGLNLDGFLEKIADANAVGPVVDPTLYRDAVGNLRALKTLAERGREFVQALEDLMHIVLTTEVKQRKKNG